MLEGDGEDDDGSVKLSEADRNTTKWWMIAGCPHLSSRQRGNVHYVLCERIFYCPRRLKWSTVTDEVEFPVLVKGRRDGESWG